MVVSLIEIGGETLFCKKNMLRVSPFYDHYTIRIRASCHNNTAPPIKLNKLSCSNTNLILLKQSCLIGQLNVPKLVSKMHVRRSGVYLYRVPTVGRPTLGFWVVPGLDSPPFLQLMLCIASTLLNYD